VSERQQEEKQRIEGRQDVENIRGKPENYIDIIELLQAHLHAEKGPQRRGDQVCAPGPLLARRQVVAPARHAEEALRASVDAAEYVMSSSLGFFETILSARDGLRQDLS
jgi:hypothetical protein